MLPLLLWSTANAGRGWSCRGLLVVPLVSVSTGFKFISSEGLGQYRCRFSNDESQAISNNNFGEIFPSPLLTEMCHRKTRIAPAAGILSPPMLSQ